MRGTRHLSLATALSASATIASASDRTDCCQVLARVPQLQEKVFYPNTSAYHERMTTYWSLSAALEPWCMVLPTSVDDVSVVISTIADNECPFGIRGGGHGTHALSNSLEDGVTIDMGFFNTTTYHPETKLASIGPGAHWGDVYDTLTPHGVTVTGGRAASVGVGGFLLGGGNSFHSGSRGFGCDQVRNYEVVLSDGTVINANEQGQQHADLWRALKGGSGNFGLVTRFDLETIEFEDPSRPEIWGGVVGYDYSQTEAIIDAFVEFTNHVDGDDGDIYSSSIMGWGYDAETDKFSIRCVLDNVANLPYPEAFDGYLSVANQTSNSLRHGTMSDMTGELVRDYRTYTIWFTGTYRNDARVLRFISTKHEEMMLAIRDAIAGSNSTGGLFSSCQAQPMTEAMISRGRGNNVLGLEERIMKAGGHPGFMFLVYVGVESAEDEAKALPFVEAFFDEVERYADSLLDEEGRSGNWHWHYLNYAFGTQDPISGYGVDSVGKIRRASEEYDPRGVFQKLRRSGFKIPE